MNEILSFSFLSAFFSATVRLATPLIIATLGETFSERGGILNLGIEGTMILGAFSGFIVTYFSGNLYLGLIAATFSGILLGLLMAFMTVTLGTSQHVSGLAITIFASGLPFFIYRLIFGSPTSPPTIELFETLQIPLLSKIPLVGNAIFNQSILTYVAFILVPISTYIIFKTSFGLNLRAIGENPEAADAAGINVYLTRYVALIISGGLMGLAGSFFTLVQFNMFLTGIVGGRGWVCIALVIFANWIPKKVLFGALLFAGIEALQLRLQAIGFFRIPFQIFLTTPYIFTIVALIFIARNASYPSALLKPYRRE